MKQNDWIILAGVILLLWYLSRRKPVEDVTTRLTYPNAQYNPDGSYAGDSTRSGDGDLLSHIIEQQGDTVQNY